jgi:dinuclear metal center YbgI/SA1388 family protein
MARIIKVQSQRGNVRACDATTFLAMTDHLSLLQAFDAMLEPQRFKDYCPNGLQVEGRRPVRKLVSGVTASLALIEAAIAQDADAIFVHHGLFWRGHDGRVSGWLRQRLALLLAHDIHLFAYHLPLDAHPRWGNNAQLGERLGLKKESSFGDQDLGCMGVAQGPGFADAQALAAHVQQVLGRSVVLVAAGQTPVRKVAWCTGGAQGYFEAAIAAGADVFITGEISEPQAHYARECGVAYIACGHHASERYGAPAVAGQVAQQLGLAHVFIDIDNPA